MTRQEKIKLMRKVFDDVRKLRDEALDQLDSVDSVESQKAKAN